MELRHLRYFVAIAEERSFTRAAERLWVAQPGLSTQIRRLEAELEVGLFKRHTRGVDLTDAGELFLERARAVLAHAELASATGRDLEAGTVGSVRLGLCTTPSWRAASGLLSTFARRRPGVEVTLLEAYGGALTRDLRDGRLDAVLAPSVYGSADLQRASVGGEPWVVLVGPCHRLAGEGPVQASELDGQDILVTGHRDAAGYDRAVADTLQSLGIGTATRRGAPGPALLAAVAAGEALALTTTPEALPAGLIARRLEPAQTLSFELFWRSETTSPALEELVRTASQIPPRHDAPARPELRAVA